MTANRRPKQFFMGSTLSPIVRRMLEDHARDRERERHQGTITEHQALDLLDRWAKGETMMTTGNLEDKQREMRARLRSREEKKQRLGRPRKTRDYEKLRRRITALMDLQAGKSVEFIAARLKKKPHAIRQWVERGMPLEGDY